MDHKAQESLKHIIFEDELLPQWAYLLELASRLCEVPKATLRWFCAFTRENGVADARTVTEHCEILRNELRGKRQEILQRLRGDEGESEPERIISAWLYALDTMIQQASTRTTCCWVIQGAEPNGTDDLGGGEIGLRRV